MKYTLLILPILLASCATTIPMQANLADQTLLLAENKNIYPDYELISQVQNGPLKQISIQKNGYKTEGLTYEYATQTAFENIWTQYFDSKFNAFSDDIMEISVTLDDLYLQTQSGTSIAGTLLTGNSQYNASAIAVISIKVIYNDEEFGTTFEVNASDYNETQTSSIGGYSYTSSETNPMQQRAVLLESALNKSVVQFENFVKSVLTAAD